MGTGAIAISLPFSCILGLLASMTSTTMGTMFWPYSFLNAEFICDRVHSISRDYNHQASAYADKCCPKICYIRYQFAQITYLFIIFSVKFSSVEHHANLLVLWYCFQLEENSFGYMLLHNLLWWLSLLIFLTPWYALPFVVLQFLKQFV